MVPEPDVEGCNRVVHLKSYAPAHSSEVAVIRALERRRFDALFADDWKGFADFCDSDLSYVHSSGTVSTRESCVPSFHGGFYDYRRIASTVDSLFVTPDLILVRATMSADLCAER